MNALTVGSLTSDHIGAQARVALPGGARDGVLIFAANPSYRRTVIRHWWLIVPSSLPQFDHDALSLQWAAEATVHLSQQTTAGTREGAAA